jgi:serine/threonine-protein kinase
VAGGGGSGLCCGLAGQGYAALALHRSLGDERWLAHARRIAAEAASTPTSDYFPAHSLWRGDLGAALLAAELSQPERAGMPLYRAVV